MITKSFQTNIIPGHTTDRDFYDIPIMGEVHIESKSGFGGNYSLGELIKNFRNQDTRSLTLRSLDDGLLENGIFSGDFLTVDLDAKVKNGDIAAVKLGDKIYIRKTIFEKDYIRLEKGRSDNSPLIVDIKTPGFEIIGKIATVIREL